MTKDNIGYLSGQYVILKPINASRHANQLRLNLNHPQIWDYFYSKPYECPQKFFSYIINLELQKNRKINNYAVCNAITGQALGFLGIDEALLEQQGSIEIVNVMFSLKLQKTTMATESFYLAAKHCFEMLHCDQLQWRCDLGNTKSYNAALRFGFYYDGIQPDHGNHYEFFYMIKPEWNEQIQDEYRRWLNVNNFNEKGQQKTKLELRKY